MADRTPRNGRALPQRQAIGRRVRAYRMALSITGRDVCQHTGAGKAQLYAIETATADVFTGTLIDVAATVGLNVALAADHHLPLLDLSAAETRALVIAASLWADNDDDPDLRRAVARLAPTTSEEGHCD